MKFQNVLSISLLGLALTSCYAKNYYYQTYAEDKQLTLGVVQKEVHKGMAQDQVAIALGSPNIVTQDKDGKETWIYDKIATQVKTSGTSGIILYCQTGADYVNRRDVSQQTLTVVIKFDDKKLVDVLSYHSSRF